MQVQNKISEIKLTATIASSRDIFRQQVAEMLLLWLQDLPARVQGGDTVREILCRLLFEPPSLSKPTVTGTPYMNEIWDQGMALQESDWQTHTPRTRLDVFLQSDQKLWKQAKSALKQMLLSTLISSPTYKPLFGVFYLMQACDLHSITWYCVMHTLQVQKNLYLISTCNSLPRRPSHSL